MPQFDQNKIVTLISEFRKSVQRLKSLATLTEKDFLNSMATFLKFDEM